MVRAHKMGGRGVQPSQWLQLTVQPKGVAAADGAVGSPGCTDRLWRAHTAGHLTGYPYTLTIM